MSGPSVPAGGPGGRPPQQVVAPVGDPGPLERWARALWELVVVLSAPEAAGDPVVVERVGSRLTELVADRPRGPGGRDLEDPRRVIVLLEHVTARLAELCRDLESTRDALGRDLLRLGAARRRHSSGTGRTLDVTG